MSMGALLFYAKCAKSEPRFASVLTLFGWTFPQLIYFIILTSMETSQNKLDYDFLDDFIGMNHQKSKSTGMAYKIGRELFSTYELV